MTAQPAVLGVFVGGASSRMGHPKGLLRAPASGLTVVEHLVAAGREADLAPVLVGEASPYAGVAPGVPRLADDPAGIGPLGGLSALLRLAGDRPAVAVACDMPHVTAAILRALIAHEPAAAVVAARREPGAPWEPLLARYAPGLVGPVLREALAAGERSFQGVLARLDPTPLPMTEEVMRALTDWDTPTEVCC